MIKQYVLLIITLFLIGFGAGVDAQVSTYTCCNSAGQCVVVRDYLPCPIGYPFQ